MGIENPNLNTDGESEKGPNEKITDMENLNENDLVSEAQNIMGKFGNMAGFDPAKMMNNPNLNLDQFANIFANMGKK